MTLLLGYARVSTLDQNPGLQQDALHEVGCWKIWTDHASSRLDRRPQLDAVLNHLQPGNTLVVWRLDRLGCSLRHLIEVVQALEQRQIGFRSLTESIDTTTPGGQAVFHLMASLAEFERDLIRERTNVGLVAARSRGRRGGRPSVMTPDKTNRARRLYDEREHTVAEIAGVLGVSRSSIYRALGKRPGDTQDLRIAG